MGKRFARPVRPKDVPDKRSLRVETSENRGVESPGADLRLDLHGREVAPLHVVRGFDIDGVLLSLNWSGFVCRRRRSGSEVLPSHGDEAGRRPRALGGRRHVAEVGGR